MEQIVCYQYFQYGKCIWLKTLYERPSYAMDCVVKWRIKSYRTNFQFVVPEGSYFAQDKPLDEFLNSKNKTWNR